MWRDHEDGRSIQRCEGKNIGSTRIRQPIFVVGPTISSGSVLCDSCSQRIIRRSTIQAAEGVPGHLERQNRTAAEDAKSSDLVAWTLEPEGEKFACPNSVESLAARTPEVYLRWLWPRG